MALGRRWAVGSSSFLVVGVVQAGERGLFSTPWRGRCSGLKATREGPVGLTKMLLSVFLNSAVMFLLKPKVTFLVLGGVLLSCAEVCGVLVAGLPLAFRQKSGLGRLEVLNCTKSFSGSGCRLGEPRDGVRGPCPRCAPAGGQDPSVPVTLFFFARLVGLGQAGLYGPRGPGTPFFLFSFLLCSGELCELFPGTGGFCATLSPDPGGSGVWMPSSCRAGLGTSLVPMGSLAGPGGGIVEEPEPLAGRALSFCFFLGTWGSCVCGGPQSDVSSGSPECTPRASRLFF